MLPETAELKKRYAASISSIVLPFVSIPMVLDNRHNNQKHPAITK